MAEVHPSPHPDQQGASVSSFQLESAPSDEHLALKIKIPMDSMESNEAFQKANQDTPEGRDAALLLEVAAIATEEIKVDGPTALWSDNDVDEAFPRVVIRNHSEGDYSSGSSSSCFRSSIDSESDDDRRVMTLDERFQWNRIRAVSIDTHDADMSRSSPTTMMDFTTNNNKSSVLISPENSPVVKRRRRRHAAIKRRVDSPLVMLSNSKNISGKGHHHSLQPERVLRGHAIKTILRKKFSWKNYPELEAFLIANREEYLRHSAMNYTVQQKQYNNRLTERLLELAAEHGFVFDEEDFTFVTVRDRIRCYFKSYVQSAKKRGIVIGYAARKAGLLSEDDLHTNVKGRIIEPPNL